MATARNQPSYDFLAGSTSPRKPVRPSARAPQTSKPDDGNESLRAQLYKLQYEVESLKQERDLAAVRHGDEIRAVQTKAEADFRRAQASESSNNLTNKKIESLTRELQESQDQFTRDKSELEKNIRSTQANSQALQEQLDEFQAELATQERHYKHQLNEVESKYATLQRTQDILKTELESKEQMIQSCQASLAARDGDVGSLENEVLRLKAASGDADTLAVIKRELSEQVTHIRQLESTNRNQLLELKQFRGQQKAIEVVEEEKRNLLSKINMMDDLRKELSEAQLQKQILEDERRSWSTHLDNIDQSNEESPLTTPEALAKAFVAERLERISLMDKMGNLLPEMTAKDEIISALEGEKLKLREELEKAQKTADAPDTKAKARIERQKTLAVKEVEYLRAQLKALDDEVGEDQTKLLDQQKIDRIQQLEELVDQYRNDNQSLHDDLSKAETNVTQSHSTLKRPLDDADDARMGQLSRKNRKLQEQATQLSTANAVLQKDLDAQKAQLAALKSTSRTRVLELRANPTARAEAIKQSTLTTLQTENRALLARLQGDASIPQVPRATLDALRAELEERDRVIADKDKHTLRLKQIFAAKSLEFREAVASLLGYKLDFMPNGRVRVTSMFHPGLSEEQGGDGTGNSIVFDGEQCTMKVSGGERSEFAGEIRGLIEFWVEGKKEIPCLLAAMTMEFWERSTRAAPAV